MSMTITCQIGVTLILVCTIWTCSVSELFFVIGKFGQWGLGSTPTGVCDTMYYESHMAFYRPAHLKLEPLRWVPTIVPQMYCLRWSCHWSPEQAEQAGASAPRCTISEVSFRLSPPHLGISQFYSADMWYGESRTNSRPCHAVGLLDPHGGAINLPAPTLCSWLWVLVVVLNSSQCPEMRVSWIKSCYCPLPLHQWWLISVALWLLQPVRNITQFEYTLDAKMEERSPGCMANPTGVPWEATFHLINLLTTWRMCRLSFAGCTVNDIVNRVQHKIMRALHIMVRVSSRHLVKSDKSLTDI